MNVLHIFPKRTITCKNKYIIIIQRYGDETWCDASNWPFNFFFPVSLKHFVEVVCKLLPTLCVWNTRSFFPLLASCSSQTGKWKGVKSDQNKWIQMCSQIWFFFSRGKNGLDVTFECYFSLHLPRLRSGRHIAQVFLPLFMLLYFSMSWNAMFLVLLTLYSVIHFIINSLPNVAASVVIQGTHSTVNYRAMESFTFHCKR